MDMCEQTADEQDPAKLIVLFGQIATLLEAKHQLKEIDVGVRPPAEGD
jgi:hypothetical protein